MQSTVSLSNLLVDMGWCLGRVDKEIAQGNIVPVRRSGRLRFIMNGSHNVEVVKRREPALQIAQHINRKSA